MKNSSYGKTRPKVSIVCVTYNQERYVAQAIESFLMQKTDFEVEIIISDDSSTDQTKSIISEYAKANPTIKAVFNEKNLGVVGNFYKAIRLAEGDYIALCEGDDFWTDRNKIQKQASYLDSHKAFSMCFHPAKIMVSGKIIDAGVHQGNDENPFTLKRLLKENFIQTNTVMYRRQKSYPTVASDILPIDWYLHLYHARQGKIGFLNEPMGVYRRHEAGVWWKNENNKLDFWQRNAVRHVRFFECVEQLFVDDSKYVTIIRQSVEKLIDEICFEVNELDKYQIATKLADIFPDYTAMAMTHHVSEGIQPQILIRNLKEQIDTLNEEMVLLNQERSDLLIRIGKLDDQLSQILKSKSWRITKPLRAINKRNIK